MTTAAPPRTRAADLSIPPPPLPEFYLPKDFAQRDNDEQEEDTKVAMKVRRYTVELNDDEAAGLLVKLPSATTKATGKTMTQVTYTDRVRYGPVATMPAPAGGAADVPPLAIYHICRLCLRTRSARYHREHPIPVNGVPPPPGICRRCRVTTVEDGSKVAEKTQCGESNQKRIGLGCIVKDEDYVSNQDYKDLHNGRNFMPPFEHLGLRHESSSARSRETREEHKKLPYRHVRVRESSLSSSPPGPKTHAESTAQDVIDAVSVKSASAVISEKSQRRPDYRGFREGGGGKITARLIDEDLPTTTQVAIYAASESSRSPPTGTFIKIVASASVQQPVQPQWSEAGIRRVARDEVERYRQAERTLEAHRDPYAHGRMVLIERRIERPAAEAEVLPWEKKKSGMTEEVVMVKKPLFQSERQSSGAHCSDWDSGRIQNREDRKESQVTERETTWVDEEIMLERVRQRPSHSTASGNMSGHGQNIDAETQDPRSTTRKPKSAKGETARGRTDIDSKDRGSNRSGDHKATDSAEPRSERSERRKWDLMSGYPTQVQPEARREVASSRRRAERDSLVHRKIWLPPWKDYEIIEITDTFDDESMPGNRETKHERRVTEQPARLRSEPERVKADSILAKAKEEPSKPVDEHDHSQSQPETGASNFRSTDRTEEKLDIKWRKRESQDQEPRRGPASLSSLGTRNRSGRPANSDSEKNREDEVASQKSRPRAFDLRWAAATAQARPGRSRDEVEDDEKTMHPNGGRIHASQVDRADASVGRLALRPEPAATHSHTRQKAPQSEHEYVYTERLVEPVGPRIHRGTAISDVGRHYTRTEEIWCKSNGSKASSRGIPVARSNAPTPSTTKLKQPETKVAEGSEHSSKVRFAAKVDISPTPPGSDASSEHFRLIGGSASSKAKLRDGESGEDLIAEFERRGRSKTREPRSPHNRTGEQEYFYERRETVREPSGVDRGWDDAPPSAWEGDSNKSQPKPLVHAYSESPARERSSRWGKEGRWEEEGSGAGPIRPEMPRQEVMDVLSGSEHTTRAEVEGGTEDPRYGHAHGRWPEDLSVLASHVR
ncbi:hypothetical protein LTR78_004635 [Recurvomyces mirabilis]|uniref:Uncharacterized protein n=1 Tax=Recurvomyces mirabilis TaxID=574656 RepID=A0AAE0WPL5_9PEZI|nr:hypothetical protein LTR78_004635 [Recurvomyces mirabilis]KAK5152872.1 hypothetical protein LTS14_007979 [Recurvomyces mirabilis]